MQGIALKGDENEVQHYQREVSPDSMHRSLCGTIGGHNVDIWTDDIFCDHVSGRSTACDARPISSRCRALSTGSP